MPPSTASITMKSPNGSNETFSTPPSTPSAFTEAAHNSSAGTSSMASTTDSDRTTPVPSGGAGPTPARP
ncbi:hypothetical protein FRC09_010387, partial [Ceratobasidium sp. 395]